MADHDACGRRVGCLRRVGAIRQRGDAGDLQVTRVLPEGRQVPVADRQIVVTFDRPVTPLGEMRLTAAESPSIVPAADCRWHWLDPRSLACELNESQALAPATEYSVTVKAGIRAQDGAELKSRYQWTFATERPAIKEYSFSTWRSAGMPVVRLVFNQPVTQDSVQAQLRFAGQAVAASPDPYSREVFYSLVLPGESRRVWPVAPIKELAPHVHSLLSVTPGLRSYAGPLLGAERGIVIEFDTFPDFRFLGVRCMVGKKAVLLAVQPPGAQQPVCDPFGTVSLAFSAPVIAPEIKAHLILTPDLTAGRTDYDPWANVYPSSQLGAPYRRGTVFTVDLPEHLRAFQAYSIAVRAVRDEFGRRLGGADAMNFRTDHRAPRLRVTHPVAVLEKDAPTAMPMYVTNLTDVDIHYRKLTQSGVSGSLTFHQPVDAAWHTA